MSRFYIKVDNKGTDAPIEVYELTCTSQMSIASAGRPTQNPVESGATISDHYVVSNDKVNFSGFISNIVNTSLTPLSNISKDGKPVATQKTVDDNFIGLRTLQKSGVPFSVFFDNGKSLSDCVFTQLDFSKGSGNISSYSVTMAMEQIQITKQALFATVQREKTVTNQAEEKTDNGDAATKTKKVSNTAVQSLLNIKAGEDSIDVVFRAGEALVGVVPDPEEGGGN